MAVTAALVKELRERTGAGMMDCKKALDETNGDMEKAIESMRKSGQAKAAKKASRVAAEGAVEVKLADDGRSAAIAEVNCETDFVAKDENFKNFVNTVTQIALVQKYSDVETLSNAQYPGFEGTVEQKRQELVTKVGENIKLRRVNFIETDGLLGSYVHSGRIGVIVTIKGGDLALAKDLAMHVAANNPVVIEPTEVADETIKKEKEIYMAQAASSGKPADIVEKMVDGQIRKFLDGMSLVGQPFVKDPNRKVSHILQEKNAEVSGFVRFEVGEGIEKEETDFAAEVMAQIKG